MKKLMVALAALGLTATTASAEVTYGNAFVKAHNLDAGIGSADLTTLGGGLEYVTGSWAFSGDLSFYDVDSLTDITLGSLGAEYRMSSGFAVGADTVRLDIDGLGDLSVHSLYAYYRTGDFAIGASVGDSSDLTETTYSVFGSYDISDTSRVGADVIRLEGETLAAIYGDYETDRFGLRGDFVKIEDLTAFAVAGSYKFTDKFAATASLGELDLGGADITALSVGVDYMIRDDLALSGSVGRLSSGGDDVDVISVGLKYEMGRRTSARRSLSGVFKHVTGTVLGGVTGF